MAGAVFVLEELTQKFDQRVAIAALAASSTAIAVAPIPATGLGAAINDRLKRAAAGG